METALVNRCVDHVNFRGNLFQQIYLLFPQLSHYLRSFCVEKFLESCATYLFWDLLRNVLTAIA